MRRALILGLAAAVALAAAADARGHRSKGFGSAHKVHAGRHHRMGAAGSHGVKRHAKRFSALHEETGSGWGRA